MSRQETMALRHTLLPEPVAPATSRCGIAARSTTTGSPPVPLPRMMGSLAFALIFLYSGLSISLPRVTTERLGLGTSMPTRDSPSTGVSIRMLGVLSASDRSFSREMMLSTLTLVLLSTLLTMGFPASSSLGRPFASVALTCL